MIQDSLDLDIIKNISIIEKLKCGILSETSGLFQNMSSGEGYDNIYILAKLISNAYLLAIRMGIDFAELDKAAVKLLKAEFLGSGIESDELALNKNMLMRFLSRNTTVKEEKK